MSKISLLLNQLFLIYYLVYCISSLTPSKKSYQNYTKIIGGYTTTIRKFPYAVMLLLQTQDTPFCGGTYLQRKWVLTAAHCITPPSNLTNKEFIENMYIKGGSTFITPHYRDQYSFPRKLVPHPDFDNETFYHDIGLIKLTRAFKINRYLRYVRIPYKYDKFLYSTPKICTAVGWGIINKDLNNPQHSDQLKAVHLRLITREKCADYFQNLIKIPRDYICAGIEDGGSDTCQGDSGGPLMYNGVQIGIVSSGHDCGLPMMPAFYTRVDLFLKWINRTVSRKNSRPFS